MVAIPSESFSFGVQSNDCIRLLLVLAETLAESVR